MGFESRAISARVTKQIVTIFSKTCDKYKIATVSIKQKAVTTLRFWFNATRLSARMTSKTTTFVTSISDIVM